MTVPQPFSKLLRGGFITASFFGLSVAAQAVAPDAVNDNLTSSPINQNLTRVISEVTLIDNDAGDGKNIEAAFNSAAGAVVTWSNSANTVTYDPTGVAAFVALDSGAFEDDTFTYRLGGTDGADDTATVTMRVNGVNDAPTITGMLGSTLNTTDKTITNSPFAGVTIGDPDTSESVTVTVALDSASKGSINNLDGFTDNGGGSYSYTGAVATATSKLVALNFLPTGNRIAPGTADNTVLTVTVDDGDATPASATRTVRVTSVNDAPVVTQGANRSMDDDDTLTVFSNVIFADVDFSEMLSVSVNYDGTMGSFSGSGFSVSGSGSSKVLTFTSSQTVANAQAALRALMFTPVPNQVAVDATETLSFSININDGDASDTESLSVVVLSVNDAPALAPTAAGTFAAYGGAMVTPFPNVTLTDADFDQQTSGGIGGAPSGAQFTATITLSPTPYGSIVSSNFTGSGATATYTGNRTQVQNAIRAAQYQAPGVSGTFEVKLKVVDSSGKANNTSNEIMASVTVTQPTPGMSGLVAGQQLSDNGVVFPFASAFFNNFGGSDRLISISLDSDSKGSFDILGSFTKSASPAPFTYSMTGNSVSATNAIQGLRFKPTANRITGTQETVTFTIRVKETSGTTLSTDTLVVTVTPFNDSPVIISDSPEIRIGDDETASPFATMSLADVDSGGQQVVTVTLTLIGEDTDTNLPSDGGGELAAGAPLTGVTHATSGSYPNVTHTIVGTPAAVTTFLKALVFTPKANRNAVGKRETVTFTVFVNDGKGGTAQNQNTTVIVTSVNGAPQINGVPPLSLQPYPLAASGSSMTKPFDALSVVDEEKLAFTITLDDATKGTLSGDDFTTSDGGTTYVYDGADESPAAITTALQALVYTLNPAYVFPVNQPGLTTFTFEAADSTNTTTKPFTIYIRERNVTHIVDSAADRGPGSLREAVDLAGNGDMIVFDFPVDDFAVTIALDSPLSIEKNLSIVGSGVDQLTISGQGSVGLFEVSNGARLTVEQLTLKNGFAASYGGAIAVDSGCALTARYCDFDGNIAGQYGGAIDVFEGELVVEKCLFRNNRVAGSIAKGGGAISVYTSGDCSVTNSTFVGNRQENASGFGGGSIYAENADLAGFFDLRVEHCTFSENADAALSGSAVLSASPGLEVHVRNNIFAGSQGAVLDVLGGGRFDSMGGNIATDATITTYTQSAQNVILLDHVTDKRSTNPLLGPLADNSGATRTCAPAAGSPAIDAAIAVSPVSAALGTDQRGVWRGASAPDIGAYESAAFKRVNINEIMVTAGAGSDFIEFYNPRESDTLDMNGLKLWIDGTLAHTFTARVLNPGAGFAWTSTVDLNEEKGSVALKNAAGQEILRVDYVATFTEEGTALVTTGESINRYPRYEGGFLPHQRVVKNVTGVSGGDLTSPGDDVDGSELVGGNSPPIAVVDAAEDLSPVYSVLANETLSPDVLTNDIEFDRTDTLKITEVMDLTAGNVTNAERFAIDGVGTIALSPLPSGLDTTINPQGASLSITPNQRGLVYNPVSSPVMIALSKGETTTDIRAYTIRDFNGSDTPQSRGPDATKQAQNIAKATNYFTVTVTGVNEAPEPMADSFATAENQTVRLLADATLLAPAVFDFGDLDSDYQDFNAAGSPVTLKPAPPVVSLHANDDDVDNDDTKTSLLLVAVHPTDVAGNLLETTSQLGAKVVLDIRAEREESSIVYDPRSSEALNKLSAGEVVTDSFYYSVFDRHGARGVAKVTVTVTGVNDVPRATDDSGFVANGYGSLSISGSTLLGNDGDPDQDQTGPDDMPLIVQPFATSSSQGATLVFDGTTVTFDPQTIPGYEALARNESIIDTFTYSITDSMGGTSQATVTVIVEGRNDAPVAADDLLEIIENQTTEVAATSGLLFNDVEVDINSTTPNDDAWVLPQRNFTTPMGARLDINPDGSYRYDANSSAIDSLKEGELAVEDLPYTVIDNNRTTASDDSFKVEAEGVSVPLPVLLNDSVVGTVPVSVMSYGKDGSNPAKVVIESPNHSLRDGLLVRIEGYQGAGSYNGVHAVTSIDRDHFSVNVPFSGDPAGSRGTWKPWFTISSVSSLSRGGALASVGGQSLLYTPTEGFYGEETFTYTIEDGVGGQDVGTVTLEVILAPLNGFVSANPDRFHLGMGEAAVVVDVLANDNLLQASGGALTINSIAPVGAASGALEIVNSGKALRYTPADLAAPVLESFTYSVSGGGSATAETTVTFEVLDRTNLLSGSDDDFFVVSGSSGNLLDVLANDPSLPAFPGTSSLIEVNGSDTGAATSSGGTVAISGNKVSYTPPASILTDSFTYTSRDASGATTTQTVKVRVVADASDFVAAADHYTVVVGSGPVMLPVLSNDGAVRNASATLSVVSLGLDTDLPPAGERVAIVGGNMVSYTPPTEAGTEDFNYEISLGAVARREGKITITVVDNFEMSHDPEDDFYHVAKNTGPHVLDVLKNDIPYPAPGWTWTVSSTSGPDHGGTLAITDGGASVSYKPASGFFGTETFSYTVRDPFGGFETASVSVKVGGLLTTPDSFAVLEGSAGNTLPVLANDDLLERYAGDYTVADVDAQSAQGGVLSIIGSGQGNRLSYSPRSGFSGEDSFTYTVADQTGESRVETASVVVLSQNSDRDVADLRVEITGINDVPVLTGTADGAITDRQTVNPFAAVSITDLDESGNQLQTVAVSFDSRFGTVAAPGMTLQSAGVYQIIGKPSVVTSALRAFVFTPFESYIDYVNPGQLDVVFTLTIDDGYIAAPIVDETTINVTPVNGWPIAVVDVAQGLSPIYSVFANEILYPDVLANDVEYNPADVLKITEVMDLTAGNVSNAELFAIDGVGTIALSPLPAGLDTTIKPQGASLTIAPDQRGLVYDPVYSPVMIALSKGETITDIWAYTIRDFDDMGVQQLRGSDATIQAQNIAKATNYFTVTVTGVNEAPEPVADSFATAENQAVRLLSDMTLLAPVVFDFEDQDLDYQDFDEAGSPVTLKPAPPVVSLLANDDDVDNDDTNTSLLLVAVHTTEVPTNLLETTSELGARVVLDIRAERGETSVIYDPRSSQILNRLSAGETATDSFYYSVFDRHGARGVAKVTVTVTGVNDILRAVDDFGFATNEDAALSIPGAALLANDSDPDQDQAGPDDMPSIIQPFATNSALGATLVFDGTSITYDPRMIAVYDALSRNESITDTFTYSITDSMGGTSQATVTVIVEGRNDAPVAAKDLFEILENQTKEVAVAGGLLSNDVDVDINGTTPDDDPWVLPQRNFTTPMGARLDINPDGSYRYDANSSAIDSLKQGQLAVETFPYTVIDNNRTTASDDSFKVTANSVAVPLPVLLNDSVVGASPVSVMSYGTDSSNPGNVIIESPNHSLRDGLLIRIDGYQGAGSYNSVHAVTSIDRDHFSVNVPFSDDPAGGRGTWMPWFTITTVGGASKGGALASVGGQSLLYTPTDGFYGEETFTYVIEDGVGGQDVGTVSLEVILAPLNGFVSASPDRFHLGMGEAAVVVDVLANDNLLPASGATLTIDSTAPVGAASGTLEIVNSGKALRYTPADLATPGEESFTYTVSGGGSSAVETTVTFEVLDRTNLLSGSDDDFFVVSGSSGNLLDVLANDASLPVFPVSSSLAKVNGSNTGAVTVSGGSVTISGNKVSYTPPASILTDTFTYTSRDASGATTTQTVKVRVVPNATDFFATADRYTVVAGSGPMMLPILSNDGAVENQSAALSVVNLGLDTDSPPSIDRVVNVGGNMIRYTPPAVAGAEDFNYEISIGTVERREAKVIITVVDAFEVTPDPEDDFYHVAKNSGPHVLDVLKNDIPYPAAGWTWTVSSTSNPDHGGTLAITAGGASVSYTPASGFFGTETFSYTIIDAFGATETATVSVIVGGLLTTPDSFAVLEDSVGNKLAVLANDDLLERYAGDYTITDVDATSAEGGVLAITGSGPGNQLSYSPQNGFSGEDSFTYTVEDQTGDSRVETVNVVVLARDSDRDGADLRVEITGVNDVPVLTGTANGAITDKQSTNPFAAVSITDLDEAGNQLQTVTVSYDSSFGTVVAPGMIRQSAGVYRKTGTPAAVTGALRAFVFTPYENFIDYILPGQADVVFTLSINDGYIPSPIVNATIIKVTPINDAPTISTPIADLVVQMNAFPRGFYLPLNFADVDDDVAAGEITWSVTGNTNPSLFNSVTVNPATRMLVLDFASNQTGFSDITVRGTDRGLLFVETTFRVTMEGPPVITLAAGQTQPPAASLVSASGFLRNYRQSFRVVNNGSLPVDAFIVHVSGLNSPVNGITLPVATYSTDEKGTLTNFLDDTISAAGVTILRDSTYVYSVKYSTPIPPGGSVVVHLTYSVSSIDTVSIRPTIAISLSTSDPQGAVGISNIALGANRQASLVFNVEAGRQYRLEYSSDMAVWKPWLTPVPVSKFPREIQVLDDGLNTDGHPSGSPRRFYRLVGLPTP